MPHPQTHPIPLRNLNAHEPMMRIDNKKLGMFTNNYKIHHSAYPLSKAQPKHEEQENNSTGKTINLQTKQNIIHNGAGK